MQIEKHKYKNFLSEDFPISYNLSKYKLNKSLEYRVYINNDFIGICRIYYINIGRRELADVWIDERMRGKNIGFTFLKNVISLIEKDISLFLVVHKNNFKAIRLYDRLGKINLENDVKERKYYLFKNKNLIEYII